jgi:hypothetical protein
MAVSPSAYRITRLRSYNSSASGSSQLRFSILSTDRILCWIAAITTYIRWGGGGGLLVLKSVDIPTSVWFSQFSSVPPASMFRCTATELIYTFVRWRSKGQQKKCKLLLRVYRRQHTRQPGVMAVYLMWVLVRYETSASSANEKKKASLHNFIIKVESILCLVYAELFCDSAYPQVFVSNCFRQWAKKKSRNSIS